MLSKLSANVIRLLLNSVTYDTKPGFTLEENFMSTQTEAVCLLPVSTQQEQPKRAIKARHCSLILNQGCAH